MQALNLYKARLTLRRWQFGETNIFGAVLELVDISVLETEAK